MAAMKFKDLSKGTMRLMLGVSAVMGSVAGLIGAASYLMHVRHTDYPPMTTE